MDKPGGQTGLRILLLEDEPTDAELTEDALHTADLSFTAKRVDTREAFIHALEEFKPDIVLADYKLPAFDGASALKIIQQQHPDIPVVMVTGIVGDETAVELLKLGAKDYVLKDRLARLGPAVRRALAEQQDIRARQAAEAALRDSEARYRRITEGLTDYQYTVRIENGQAVETTQGEACVTVTGYRAEEFSADPYLWIQMVAAEDREMVLEHVRQILAGKDVAPIEHRIIRKDGALRWVSDTTILLRDASGKLLSYDGVIKDITERRQAAQALLESESQLRLLLDSAAEAIYGIDLQGNCTFCNPSCLRLLGYRHAGELAGKNMHGLIHYRHADGTPYPEKDCRIYRAFLTDEKIHADDEVLWRSDGACFPVEYWAHPQLRNGIVTGAVVTFLDITERKQAQAALQAALEFNRNLIDSMQDGISVLDTKGVHLDVNPALCRITGFSREELIGAGAPHPYWPPEELENINASFQQMMQGNTGDFESTFMRKNGERFPVVVSPFPVKDKVGDVVSYTATIKDITKRKIREALLAKQLDELRRWHDATQGREMRILEFKHEINELLRQSGQPPRYPSAEASTK